MEATERLARMRKRFGIAPEKHDGPKDICVQVCADALDRVRTGEVETYPDAITRGFGALPDSIRLGLAVDINLRIITMATVSGMMDCLTTEWHS